MKKKICSKVLVIMLILAALFTSGCGPEVRLGAIMLRDAIKGDSPFFEDSGSKWKTIKLEQNDGKILQLDLPFALNDNGEFESDDIVQNAEWHRYKNDSIFVSVDHCRLADSKKEVTEKWLKTKMSKNHFYIGEVNDITQRARSRSVNILTTLG